MDTGEIDTATVRTKFEAEFSLADRLLKFFDQLFDGRFKNRQVSSEEEHMVPMLQLCARAQKTARAIVILGERGFGEDAGILARALVETVFHFLYMARDPRIRGLLYFRHELVSELEGFARFKQGPGSERLTSDIDESQLRDKVEAIESKIKQIRPSFDFSKLSRNDSKGWTGKTISEIVKDLGPDGERQYRTTFWILSGYTHPSPVWMSSLRVENEAGILVDPGPSTSYVKEIILSALCYYLIMLYYGIDDFFSLGYQSSIGEFEAEFRRVAKTSNLPDIAGKNIQAERPGNIS